MSVQEIEAAVTRLEPDELARFAKCSRSTRPTSGIASSRRTSQPDGSRRSVVKRTRISSLAERRLFEPVRHAVLLVGLPRLTPKIRSVADKNFDLLKRDPRYPSLRLKKAGAFWSVRVGRDYRAVARNRTEGLVWFWIGSHDRYDRLIA